MKYLVKKLWPLILLLLAAIVVVIVATPAFWAYNPSLQYVRFALYVIGMGLLAGALGAKITYDFDATRFPFKAHAWERDGRWYKERLHIEAWKDKVIDMSKASDHVAGRELGKMFTADDVHFLIQQTCVAEVTHKALCVLGLLLFVILQLGYAIFFYAFYLLFNLLDIAIQRYNRFRLVKIYNRLVAKESRAQARRTAAQGGLTAGSEAFTEQAGAGSPEPAAAALAGAGQALSSAEQSIAAAANQARTQAEQAVQAQAALKAAGQTVGDIAAEATASAKAAVAAVGEAFVPRATDDDGAAASQPEDGDFGDCAAAAEAVSA